MGIVVTLFMLLGLLILSPFSALNLRNRLSPNACLWAGRGVMLLGFWNSAWYGLQHLDRFWGWAALVSGIAMVLTGLMIQAAHSTAPAWLAALIKKITAIKSLVLLVLLGSFLLYAITLIRLNLGLSITT